MRPFGRDRPALGSCGYLRLRIFGQPFPLVLGLPLLAAVFTVLNAAVLAIRIRAENRALAASRAIIVRGAP